MQSRLFINLFKNTRVSPQNVRAIINVNVAINKLFILKLPDEKLTLRELSCKTLGKLLEKWGHVFVLMQHFGMGKCNVPAYPTLRTEWSMPNKWISVTFSLAPANYTANLQFVLPDTRLPIYWPFPCSASVHMCVFPWHHSPIKTRNI